MKTEYLTSCAVSFFIYNFVADDFNLSLKSKSLDVSILKELVELQINCDGNGCVCLYFGKKKLSWKKRK